MLLKNILLVLLQY